MKTTNTSRKRRTPVFLVGGSTLAVAVGIAVASAAPSSAAQAPVGLGTADSFAVLGGAGVSNTGPSILNGDLGVSPGKSITGFPPGIIKGGAIHKSDGVAQGAQSDLTTAYNKAAGAPVSQTVGAELGGKTLLPGVYKGDVLGLTGDLTLDAKGDPKAVFIFQSAKTLITASASKVQLTNGASPCNVYWQVGSSATLGTGSAFTGTVMALTSIAAQTTATVEGRLLARNGEVTLDNNTITKPSCNTTPGPTDGDAAPGPTDGNTTPGPTDGDAAPGPTDGNTTPGPTDGNAAPGPTDGNAAPGPTDGNAAPGPTDGNAAPGPTDGDAAPGSNPNDGDRPSSKVTGPPVVTDGPAGSDGGGNGALKLGIFGSLFATLVGAAGWRATRR